MVTNACYAMRVRLESGDEPGYEPRLLVSSHLRGQEVAVVVSDNGTGIAEDILTSIFNPFFTTRSGALGAGLGLPLAADVVRRGGWCPDGGHHLWVWLSLHGHGAADCAARVG